jgi:hypothetical protein
VVRGSWYLIRGALFVLPLREGVTTALRTGFLLDHDDPISLRHMSNFSMCAWEILLLELYEANATYIHRSPLPIARPLLMRIGPFLLQVFACSFSGILERSLAECVVRF